MELMNNCGVWYWVMDYCYVDSKGKVFLYSNNYLTEEEAIKAMTNLAGIWQYIGYQEGVE